jgi:hypothetical protein
VAGRPVETDAPVFAWTPVPDATHYRLQIATTDDFASPLYDETTDRGAAIPLGALLPDDVTTVYWRVRADAEDEALSEWSAAAHFAVASTASGDVEGGLRVEAAPVPLQPDAEQAPLDRQAVPFTWEEVPEASGYQLQVAETEDFVDPTLDFTVDRTTSITLYDGLPPEPTTLHWRIRSLFRAADPGPWSAARSFTIAPPTEGDRDLAPETGGLASARAAGPVLEARTSASFSLLVSLLAVLSFLVILLLIVLAG